MSAALEDVKPFTVRLEKFNLFEHRESATVFIEPTTKVRCFVSRFASVSSEIVVLAQPADAVQSMQAKIEGESWSASSTGVQRPHRS
jgi:hypothetical protein